MTEKPIVTDAPGITWRLLKRSGWECRWRVRKDIGKKGFQPKVCRLWCGTKENPTPNEFDIPWIQERAQFMQAASLEFNHGGQEASVAYGGSVRTLIACYKTDDESEYHSKRYKTREHYDTLCRRLEKDCGHMLVSELDARTLKALHRGWSADGKKIAMGHAVVGMLRTLATFGKTLLKCPDCKSLQSDLHDMRFKMPPRRKVWITSEQTVAVRNKAREKGFGSIALAQAFQWDVMFRQKDVIGEWVPLTEPGISDVIEQNQKWLRGLRGEEIDPNLILRHTTSKKGKDVEFDLNLAPCVLEEVRLMNGLPPDAVVTRAHLPASGPIVISEQSGVPWTDFNFRRRWREIAKAAGVPAHVFSMDSRAGAITEASDAGAPMEHIRQAATHSDISTTAGYSRGQANKTAEVAKIRIGHRNKTGTI